MGPPLLVADGVDPRILRGPAGLPERASLGLEAGIEHGLETAVDPRRQLGARAIQPDGHVGPWWAAPGLETRQRLPGQEPHLEGAIHPLPVRGVEAPGGRRVHARQRRMALGDRNRIDARASPVAFRFTRPLLHAVERSRERCQVQPRSAAHDRHPAARADRGDRLPGLGGEIRRGVPLSHVDHVEQMVGHALPLLGGRFRGADLEPAIHLSRVRDHDLAVQLLGDLDGDLGLADGGRPRDHEILGFLPREHPRLNAGRSDGPGPPARSGAPRAGRGRRRTAAGSRTAGR